MVEPGHHYYLHPLRRIVFVHCVRDGLASYERSYVTGRGWIAHGNGAAPVEDFIPVYPRVPNLPLDDDYWNDDYWVSSSNGRASVSKTDG